MAARGSAGRGSAPAAAGQPATTLPSTACSGRGCCCRCCRCCAFQGFKKGFESPFKRARRPERRRAAPLAGLGRGLPVVARACRRRLLGCRVAPEAGRLRRRHPGGKTWAGRSEGTVGGTIRPTRVPVRPAWEPGRPARGAVRATRGAVQAVEPAVARAGWASRPAAAPPPRLRPACRRSGEPQRGPAGPSNGTGTRPSERHQPLRTSVPPADTFL
jgi:hypothetical protein